MNILMLFEDLSPESQGGIQIHVATLAKELGKRGNHVILFPVPPIIIGSSNVRFILLMLRQFFFIYFRLAKLLYFSSHSKVRLIHAHGKRLPFLFGVFFRAVFDCPLVVTMHESKSLASRFKWSSIRADRVIAISREIRTILLNQGYELSKLSFIPNIIGAKWFQHDIEGNIRFERFHPKLLFVGRLESSKLGLLELLFRAIPEISRDFTDFQILIVSQWGPAAAAVHKQIERINREAGRVLVHSLGYLSDPSVVVQQVDVVLGVGRVAMEAMAKGKAVIVGFGNPDLEVAGDIVLPENVDALMKTNFTGRAYPRKMDKEELARIIKRLAQDESYRKRVEVFSKRFAEENFSTKSVIDRIEHLYSESLSRE